MKRIAFYLPVALIALASHADAQTISPAWNSYRQQQTQSQQPQQPQQQAQASQDQQPQTVQQTEYAQPQPQPAYQQPQYTPAPAYRAAENDKGGFFIGAQAGKGWIYEDIDQDVVSFNAGYRWQAGPAVLVGVEVAGGKLRETQDSGYLFPEVSYGSVGANARFNFGAGNPLYGIARLGYWSAEADDGYGNTDDIDGVYAGLGLGVDITRNFNVNLVFSSYVYSNEYYYNDYYYDLNRADTLTLGLELRF